MVIFGFIVLLIITYRYFASFAVLLNKYSLTPYLAVNTTIPGTAGHFSIAFTAIRNVPVKYFLLPSLPVNMIIRCGQFSLSPQIHVTAVPTDKYDDPVGNSLCRDYCD